MRRAALAIALAVLWTLFAVSNIHVWRVTHRPTGLPIAAFELVSAYLFLVRRPSNGGRAPLAAWTVGFAGTAAPLLLRPVHAEGGALAAALLAIQVASALLALVCLAALGRSFGIVAANRGLRTRGPYRIVRHPVYASYTCLLLAYSGENPTWRNLAVVIAATAVQVTRIRYEERYLERDPTYREYALRVRWRLLPGLY